MKYILPAILLFPAALQAMQNKENDLLKERIYLLAQWQDKKAINNYVTETLNFPTTNGIPQYTTSIRELTIPNATATVHVQNISIPFARIVCTLRYKNANKLTSCFTSEYLDDTSEIYLEIGTKTTITCPGARLDLSLFQIRKQN